MSHLCPESRRTARAAVLLALWPLLSVALSAQAVFKPSLFAPDDFIRLRQTPPLEHLRVYQRMLPLRSAEIVSLVRFRHYKQLDAKLDEFNQILACVMEDVDLCTGDTANRLKPEVREFTKAVRLSLARLNGAVAGLPESLKGKPAPVVKRMDIVFNVLQSFINPGAKS